MAKIYCHSLLSGSSWSSFEGESSEEEAEAMEVDENNTFGPSEATRLRCEDMNLYGLCPAQEEVRLVICKECKRVVKVSTFSRHCALLHQKVIPPPTPSPELVEDSTTVELLLESEPKTSSPSQAAIKIEKLEIEDSSVKIEEVPLTVPKANHAIISKKIQNAVNNAAMKKSSSTNRKSPRKIIPTREREFDADKHCGVWVEEQKKRCTRSLTCKTHALSLRRAVPGRRKKFDELLAEHKARANCEKEQQQQNLAALKLLESKNTDKNSVLKGNGLITEQTSKPSNDKNSHTLRLNSSEVSEDTSGVPQKNNDGESDGIDDAVSYNDLTSLNYHPKPLATCTFGGRKVGHGAVIFNRRQDHLRCAMLAMVERCLNPSQQRHPSGRPGAAAILHRPSIKTIAQSSNHGLFKGSSTLGEKKNHLGSGRNLSNFLKAPPPPRNRSMKHNNVLHSNHSVKHSVDTSTGFATSRTSNSKNVMDSSTSNITAAASEGSGFLKPDASSQAISDIGNIIASIDGNVSNGQPVVISQTQGINSRTTSGNLPSGVSVSLDSNSCSNLGANSDVSMTGTRTAYTTVYTTINNSSSVNTTQGGNVKEILPAPLSSKVNGVSGGTVSPSNAVVQIAGQLDPSLGKVAVTSTGTQRESPVFFTTQNSGNVQMATSLPNGTGPSPPPIVTSVKGYPLSFVIQGSSGNKAGTAVAAVANQAAVGFTKGHSLVFNNMGMAQMQQQSGHIIAQQPTSPLKQQQVQQKGKVLLRANSYPRANNKTCGSQGKIPQSASSQQQQQQLSPGQVPSQQKTIIVTSPPPGQQNLYLNHQHIPNTSQPIVQLKQQVEQQQQQLQQITLQQQLQQQQLQQQQLQQHKQINSQFVKQQLPIQPRLAPAPHPPSQSLITQQQISGQNIVIKAADQPLKSPPNSVFVTTDSHQNIQTAVNHKPQSNVA